MNSVQKFLGSLIERKYGRMGNYLFYRCRSCSNVLTGDVIALKGQCRCGHSQFSPTNLTFFEEVKFIFKSLF